VKAAEYERMFAAEQRQWWYVGMRTISRAILARECGDAPVSRVLDAGCGTGGNLVWLGQLGRAVGVDLSPQALALARQRAITVARGDVLRLPFRDGEFDLVTSFDVLYHRWVSDDEAAVRELVRVLRPGGLLFIRVPALKWLWGAHDEEVLSRHRYARNEVSRLLSTCGLKDVRSTYCNALLFPIVALRRALDRWLQRRGSDVEFLPAPIEWAFRAALQVEAWWLRRGTLPIGSSVLAWGRKQSAAGESVHDAK
jgi:SAM-dependent methyltransferase